MKDVNHLTKKNYEQDLHKALEKRPVSSDQIENALQNIKDYIRKIGEREIQAQVIGKQVMNQLKDLRSSCLCKICLCISRFSRYKRLRR